VSGRRPTREDLAGKAYLDLRRAARAAGRLTDEYLRLYVLEGFLARLATSQHADDLIVKGGVLLAAYAVRRPTADIDIAAQHTPGQIQQISDLVARHRRSTGRGRHRLRHVSDPRRADPR
jgi:hypothetical protein